MVATKIIKRLKKNKLEFLFLAVILLLSAFLRLYQIAGYMTFLGDEGRDVLVVKRMIVDHKWTLLGPTASVGGFFLGPIYYYLMIPFLWAFNFNPVGPAVMVALFGVATVFLVYWAGREFFDAKVGLLAASLYAISPLIIAYSRSSWNPNLVPFFALFYVYSLSKIVETRDWRWWIFSGLLLGIGLQLHYLFTFLIVMGIVFLFAFKKGLAFLKFWGLKISGLIIGWSPFIIFELRHGFPNARSLYQFIFFGQETGLAGGERESLGEIVFRLFARPLFSFPPPEQYYRYSKVLLLTWRGGVILTIIAALGVLVAHLIKKKKAAHFLLLFWLVFGVGLFAFYKKEVYDYYLGIVFPLPFLLTALMLVKIAKVNKAFCSFVLLFFCSFVLLNLQGISFRYPPNRQLEQTQKIAKIIFDAADGKPFNFALITGQNSDHAYRYFLELWDNPPQAIENPQIDPERKSVADQLLVVCEVRESDCHPLGHSLWEIAGFGRAEIVQKWQAPGGITVMKLGHWRGETEL